MHETETTGTRYTVHATSPGGTLKLETRFQGPEAQEQAIRFAERVRLVWRRAALLVAMGEGEAA